MKKRCLHCKKWFKTKHSRKKHCSVSCSEERPEKLPRFIKVCETCQTTFHTARNSQVYCSKKCLQEKYRSAVPPDLQTIGRGAKGTYGELLVSADLIKKGWYVYRALSPHSPCDLIAVKGQLIKRIEVTLGKRVTEGKISFNPHNDTATGFDIVAVVIANDNSVVYIPELS